MNNSILGLLAVLKPDFGFLAIMDFPDHTTVTGMALNIAASGSFQGNITPLITVEEMDEMVKVNVGDYRYPGK